MVMETLALDHEDSGVKLLSLRKINSTLSKASMMKNSNRRKNSRTNSVMKIQFNDAATSTYEYPSEQSLLEQLSPEERLEMERENAASSHDEGMNSDGEDSEMMVGGGLKSNPAIGAAGNLANYQAKYLPDYALGMQMNAEETVVKRPEPQRPKNPEDVSIKPAEEDDTSTWSSSTTSDLLF